LKVFSRILSGNQESFFLFEIKCRKAENQKKKIEKTFKN
jgi:hypothetical protein